MNLVSALCKAVALCFPTRGFAELAVIKEFIKRYISKGTELYEPIVITKKQAV